jgi:hypothetical protein
MDVNTGAENGKFFGYHTTPEISDATAQACAMHVSNDKKNKRRYSCGDPTLVMLPSRSARHIMCVGEIFFQVDGAPTKKIV